VALFGKSEKPSSKHSHEAVPVVGREVYCRICDAYRPFTKCWLRQQPMTRCPECGAIFHDVEALYRKFQPVCPQCGAFLEQPGFEYGLCDVCGSRFEIVTGAKPGLLPNRRQRAEMAKHGKAWRLE